jgi:Putative restriction endonuclease
VGCLLHRPARFDDHAGILAWVRRGGERQRADESSCVHDGLTRGARVLVPFHRRPIAEGGRGQDPDDHSDGTGPSARMTLDFDVRFGDVGQRTNLVVEHGLDCHVEWVDKESIAESWLGRATRWPPPIPGEAIGPRTRAPSRFSTGARARHVEVRAWLHGPKCGVGRVELAGGNGLTHGAHVPEACHRASTRANAKATLHEAMAQLPLSGTHRGDIRHVRAPQPIVFPEEAEVPEGKRHLVLRTFLFRMLSFALGPAHSVGSDQFVYWNARDPRRNLAPDVFVKMGVADAPFGSWKAWQQGGAPEMAVEIVSPHEGDGVAWEEKLARYHELGVRELIRFDPDAPEGGRLRVWDRVHDDLVERLVATDSTPCGTLGLVWRVLPVEGEPVGLRLVDDQGRVLEVREEFEARGRAAAEARVRELEAELAKRSSG